MSDILLFVIIKACYYVHVDKSTAEPEIEHPSVRWVDDGNGYCHFEGLQDPEKTAQSLSTESKYLTLCFIKSN